jgi:SAM-dependent methyltransferase
MFVNVQSFSVRPLLLAWLLFFQNSYAQDKNRLPTKAGEVVAKLALEVEAAKLVVSNPWVVEWMSTVGKLPKIEPRTISYNKRELVVDEEMVYSGRYGSPLAYARVLDLAVSAGFQGKPSARVFDFGYGSIGHLKMLALSGQHCVGVDVAPLLKVIYADSSGPLGSGSVQVLDGSFPKDDELKTKVGTEFDLVLSKNVLKLGYIHPTREVSDARMVIDLGVDDETFLSSIARMMKPNGLFVIYNFCPAKSSKDKPYIPWAEGESPFSREAFQIAGFEVLQFDAKDDLEARRLAHALNWDTSGGMNLETDLFAWYTIVRRRP